MTTLWRSLALAAIYWAAGKLALWMAIPPGYATAVWPAAGFALVAVLMHGARVAPGVLIGSFCVNVGTSFDGSSLEAIAKSVTLALALGAGASLQAIAGAFLVRRYVGFPSPLDGDRSIAGFVLLGGPSACVVSATAGVATLCATGLVPWSNFAFSWFTWWVGDSIGVLIFAPLALTLVGTPRVVWRRRRLLLGIPLAAGFALTTLIFLRASAWEETRIGNDFERKAIAIARPLEAELNVYQNLLISTASFLDASPDASRESFRLFVQRALRRYPGIQAFSWNPRVTGSERARYEAAAQADGFSNFVFTEKDANGALVPAPPRSEYVVVFYIEPYEGNERALSYNIASEPTRIAALARARESGAATVTGRITLVQERRTQFGVLLLVPIFDRTSRRPDALRGYAVGVFRMGDLIDASLDGVDHAEIDLALFDESAPVGEQLLYGDETERAAFATAETSRFRWTRRIEFGGRAWRIDARATPAYVASQRSWHAWMVLAAGLLFTGLLGVVILMATGRTARVEEEVQARTRELVAANETLAASERALRASDGRSQALLGELEALNRELEDRVEARTKELSQANAHLASASAELEANLLKLQNTQEQLLQTGKLAAVGQLAAGLAHEINNPLAVILGFAQALERMVDIHSPLRMPVSSIAREALRCRTLVSELLTFSRTGKKTLESVDVNAMLRSSARLLDARARAQDTHLLLDLTDGIPEPLANQTQLEQVVVNLGNNALDAMERGGKLALRSRWSGNGEVHLEVEDTGPGIPEEIRARMFEPFFTTKEVGKGTGLGLSLAYEIVRQYGGAIEVRSQMGRGTNMVVRLPTAASNGGHA